MIFTNMCSLSKRDGESVSHVLLHCSFSWEVWFGIIRDFGMGWVPPLELGSLLFAWKGKAFSFRGRNFWRLVLVVVCWSTWLEKNTMIFEGHVEPSFQV